MTHVQWPISLISTVTMVVVISGNKSCCETWGWWLQYVELSR